MASPLIPAFETLDETSFNDVLVMFARNIEDALIEAGAEPGVDYSRLDLFKLAQPYVMERFKGDALTYTKGWKV